jgi:hypothetical protein
MKKKYPNIFLEVFGAPKTPYFTILGGLRGLENPQKIVFERFFIILSFYLGS